MEFRTIVNIPKLNLDINYKSKIVLFGSCFTENIGGKLKELMFDVNINPFGILYNPISVKNSLDFIIENKKFNDQDIAFQNERWFSYYHHSRFSNSDKNKCIENINDSISIAHSQLKDAKFLFLTFGTARVYKLIESNKIVSNCHKQPSSLFSNEILSVEEIVAEYKELITKLKGFNKNLQIIFTVSPVRHWKDGAHENQISKSTLILAINKLVEEFENASYFPAYEILMDDLRDYRFYAEDMLHPNEIGINYVWEKFKEAYFNNETKRISEKISALIKAKEHRAFNPESESYKKFNENNLKKIKELESLNLEIDLIEFKHHFSSKK